MQKKTKVLLMVMLSVLALEANACDLSKHRGGQSAGHGAPASQQFVAADSEADEQWSSQDESEVDAAPAVSQPRISRRQQARVARAVRAEQQRLQAQNYN